MGRSWYKIVAFPVLALFLAIIFGIFLRYRSVSQNPPQSTVPTSSPRYISDPILDNWIGTSVDPNNVNILLQTLTNSPVSFPILLKNNPQTGLNFYSEKGKITIIIGIEPDQLKNPVLLKRMCSIVASVLRSFYTVQSDPFLAFGKIPKTAFLNNYTTMINDPKLYPKECVQGI